MEVYRVLAVVGELLAISCPVNVAKGAKSMISEWSDSHRSMKNLTTMSGWFARDQLLSQGSGYKLVKRKDFRDMMK